MDFVNKISGNEKQERSSGGGGGMMDKVNNGLGGGQSGEKNEGESALERRRFQPLTTYQMPLTRVSCCHGTGFAFAVVLTSVVGVDFAQERMGQGSQNNESAVEQAKDEKISDGIRSGYKGATGKDIPIQDK
ncbi:hypothetical protein BD626DRAFT_476688 [Schizophyllum amplum]|uniref:Uncharacterized protein n=1 Tax=Schizophyllum amplum TaxID=97359 RepID=A0A550CZL3_9AGAR|nr:hypothetical protein BD626DRAFT_476688 [Auriculariopsis ampla]